MRPPTVPEGPEGPEEQTVRTVGAEPPGVVTAERVATVRAQVEPSRPTTATQEPPKLAESEALAVRGKAVRATTTVVAEEAEEAATPRAEVAGAAAAGITQPLRITSGVAAEEAEVRVPRRVSSVAPRTLALAEPVGWALPVATRRPEPAEVTVGSSSI